MSEAVLSAHGATKTFGGQRALDRVDFEAHAGSIHALLGENGAGKSTLIKIFAGVHQPDEGWVAMDGVRCEIHSPRDARALGLGFLHQQLHLAPDLTVRENLLLTSGYPRRPEGRIDWRRVDEIAEEHLALAGIAVSPREVVSELSTAQQQLVAFARVLLQRPKVVFLDEPTASLGEADSRHMLELLQAQRRQGATIVYITHRLEEVLELADTVTVLRDGRKLATVPRDGLTRDRLVEMLGGVPDQHATPVPAQTMTHAVPRLELRDAARDATDRPTSLKVWPGEVLGIAGLVGSGRTRLASMIAGLSPMGQGTMLLDGEAISVHNVRDALAHGIVMVSESRALALVPDFGVAANISLGHVDRYAFGGIAIRNRQERAAAAGYVEQLAIKGSKDIDEVRLMSGGNQQKVLLARALDLRPRLLILDEPTAGIDIGTKQFIYDMTRQLARTGMSVVFISSELEEVSLVADRIAVWKGGRPTEELPAGTSRAAIVARLFADASKANGGGNA